MAAAAGVTVGVWVNQRLERELTRVESARSAAETALVRHAAERVDAELRELATVPQLLAFAFESGEPVRPELLTQLIARDDRIHGLCVAREPEAGAGFALLAQRSTAGVRVRHLDQEAAGPPYWERDWYITARTAGRTWTDPYLGTDDQRTLMVSRVVPIRRGWQFHAVVVLDLAVESLRSVQAAPRDLIPGVNDSCRVVTKDGRVLFNSGAFADLGTERSAPISSTGWRLIVSFPFPRRRLRRPTVNPGTTAQVEFWLAQLTHNPASRGRLLAVACNRLQQLASRMFRRSHALRRRRRAAMYFKTRWCV